MMTATLPDGRAKNVRVFDFGGGSLEVSGGFGTCGIYVLTSGGHIGQ